MTRRELLAMVPAAATVKTGRAAEVPFERIDTHNHIHRSAPALIASMEKTGWRGLSICDSREVGDQVSALPEMIQGTAGFHRESQGRWAWATTFDARDFEKPGFADRVIGGLQQGFAQEAIAVKIWKNIGMGIRSKSGEYLLPDNPALLPIYEAIQKAGKTLICHLAEPNGAWLPLDAANTESGYLKNHPEWHMYGHPEAPSKDTILAARDRVVARYPKLRVIGCHLGSNEEDLDRLAKRLDALPNLVVDVASRVRYLMAGDREKVRQFVLKYQDRILYATDFTLGPGDDARAAQSLQATHDREWNFFATGETVQSRDRQVQGLALPERALRKIFHENAVRNLPGILA
ncbi:MAG TPA: amidohydrolase family protein [Candidatus Acidoferrales bacterium]|jgi:predicted TIM-barrel fold metal-dependent hydrolase|nr:amidohydrolase family protein [Candidatus Acidoferrales bacterium]